MLLIVNITIVNYFKEKFLVWKDISYKLKNGFNKQKLKISHQ